MDTNHVIYSELQTKEEILNLIWNHYHFDNNDLAHPMFHGTDLSLVGMSKDERSHIMNACETVIKSIYLLLEPITASDAGNGSGEYAPYFDYRNPICERLSNLRDSYASSYDALIFAMRRIREFSNYQYGDFYVTDDIDRAIGYSREAWIFGETGWCANRLLEGAELVGVDLPKDSEFEEAISIINARKQKEKTPVVLMILDSFVSELLHENGYELDSIDLETLKSLSSYGSYRLRAGLTEKKSNVFMIREERYEELRKAILIFKNDARQ